MSKEQIEEMAFDLYLIDMCKHLPQEECHNTTCAHCEAEALYNAGYRKQSEGEWELFNLITSTYHGKQYYFLNKDGSVYSRASHSNMSRDEAINEFLDNFRF